MNPSQSNVLHSFFLSCRFLPVYIMYFSIPANAQNQDGRLLFYNVGLGAVSAGIGAVCNKPKGSKWRPAFLNGFWQGAIGGAFRYTGKKTTGLIDKKHDISYGLPAMLLHSVGNSIIENAAYSRPFLQSWNLYYGPVRVDFTFKDAGALKVRFLPYTIFSLALAAKGPLDWKASLMTGCITFRTDKRLYVANKGNTVGVNYGRATIYSTAHVDNTLLTQAHELVHYFQLNEYLVVNSFFAPLTKGKSAAGLKEVFSKYIYFDAPYSLIPYWLEGYEPYHPYRNYFELESERFATGKDVPL
jgi:hypothetical protein